MEKGSKLRRGPRDTAKALLDQTADQKKAGLAAAVDVQSDVEVQAREQKLIVARNNLAKQKLVLARAIGLPAGQTFVERQYYCVYRAGHDRGLKVSDRRALPSDAGRQIKLRAVLAGGTMEDNGR